MIPTDHNAGVNVEVARITQGAQSEGSYNMQQSQSRIQLPSRPMQVTLKWEYGEAQYLPNCRFVGRHRAVFQTTSQPPPPPPLPADKKNKIMNIALLVQIPKSDYFEK